MIDNTYNDHPLISGISLSKDLHERGYTRLYILSGTQFDATQLPDYLITLTKDLDGMEMLKMIVQESMS